MERHLTMSAVSSSGTNANGRSSIRANRTSVAFDRNARTQPAMNETGSGLRHEPGVGLLNKPGVGLPKEPGAGLPKEPGAGLRSVSVWTHTLILTGELTHRSAHLLEAEIERLCEQGVTDITLDLRQLTSIDSIGVAVISFRCSLCRRQGYGFTLIPGPRLIHRAFEQAGVIDLLPFQGDEVAARRLRAAIPGQRSRR
jgi:anti-anti-sigma factor